MTEYGRSASCPAPKAHLNGHDAFEAYLEQFKVK